MRDSRRGSGTCRTIEEMEKDRETQNNLTLKLPHVIKSQSNSYLVVSFDLDVCLELPQVFVDVLLL